MFVNYSLFLVEGTIERLAVKLTLINGVSPDLLMGFNGGIKNTSLHANDMFIKR